MSSKKLIPYTLISPAMLFFVLLLAVPMLSTLVLSLHASGGFSAEHYVEVFSDLYFLSVFQRTFMLAATVTFICLLLGTPQAIILNRMRDPWRGLFLVAILGPFLISVVVRTLGWSMLLGPRGPISEILLWLGMIDRPLSLIYTMTGMVIALVHVMVPFVVVAVWVSLQRLDPDVENAAASLGASNITVLRKIIIPQIVPGIISGSIIVFSLSATAFATPAIIGGRRLKVAATAIYDEFMSTLNWPLGATIAIVLLIANFIILAAYNKMLEAKQPKPSPASLHISAGAQK